eukprot:53159-Eustigmatos_ZCMA.PRE.1
MWRDGDDETPTALPNHLSAKMGCRLYMPTFAYPGIGPLRQQRRVTDQEESTCRKVSFAASHQASKLQLSASEVGPRLMPPAAHIPLCLASLHENERALYHTETDQTVYQHRKGYHSGAKAARCAGELVPLSCWP